MRKQTEERNLFSYATKEKILAKSNGKCCRCGRKLSLSDNTYEKPTVEHIIPLSKGGTNDDDNLVALCEDCNTAKGNQIIIPKDYLTYLNKEHLSQVQRMYIDYCTDVSWFSTHCYTREDVYPIVYEIPVTTLCSKTPKIKQKNTYYQGNIRNTAILQRCKADDLSDIYEYIIKYNQKMDLPNEGIKDVINDVFAKGCIYKLHKKGEVIALFPMLIVRENIGFEGNVSHLIYSILCAGLPVLYQKDYYLEPISMALEYIMECLSHLNEYKAVHLLVDTPKNDSYINKLMMFYTHGETPAADPENDRWLTHNICCAYKNSDVEEYDESALYDSEKITLAISRGIERNMKLKTIEQFQKGKNRKEEFFKTNEAQKRANKAQKKAQKREQVDEYDPKYYGFG